MESYGAIIKKWVRGLYSNLSVTGGVKPNNTKEILYGFVGHPEPEPAELLKKKKDGKKHAKGPAKTPAKAQKPAGEEEEEDADDETVKQAKKLTNAINLVEIRDTTKAINVYFDHISSACKLGAPPAVPIKKPAGKKAAEDEDDEDDK